MTTDQKRQEIASKVAIVKANQKNPISMSYELFILLVSILSIFNIFIVFLPIYSQSIEAIKLINLMLSLIFLGDFLFRLHNSKSKSFYFFKGGGWIDLLSSMPIALARLLRMLRVVKVIKTVKTYGFDNMVKEFSDDRANSTLLSVLFFLLLVFEFGAAFVLGAEKANPDANIKTASDAIWWTYVTVTTVGYGDKFPTTDIGRIMGALVMTAGVGLFGVLTGYLANAFLAPRRKSTDNEPKDRDTMLKEDIAKIKASLEELESKL